jgi:HSP20 family protein
MEVVASGTRSLSSQTRRQGEEVALPWIPYDHQQPCNPVPGTRQVCGWKTAEILSSLPFWQLATACRAGFSVKWAHLPGWHHPCDSRQENLIENKMAEQQNHQKEFFSEVKNEFKEIGAKVTKIFDDMVRGKEGARSYVPATDVWETKEALVYELDLPGCAKSDFSVQLRDNCLVIKGLRNRSTEANVSYLQRERGFGEFERIFPIPANIVQSGIKAKYENGVLRLTLAKEAVEIEPTQVVVE